jgi:hypothetical protein
VTFPPSNLLVWFGVIGGPCAWAAQFVVSLAFSFAQCNQPAGRWQLPVHGWQIATSAVGVAVGLASTAVSLWMFMRTFHIGDVDEEERRGEGGLPPVGRIHFLAIVGLTVNFLALAIMVMTGIGAPLLPTCQQS